MIPEREKGSDAAEEIVSPVRRTRRVLINLCQYMRQKDKDAQIITWNIKDNFTFLPIEDFPDDVLAVSEYFSGYRKNLKDDRRVYLKFSIHTTNDDNALYREMINWAEAFGSTLTPCLIQSSTASLIGWLVYSSYFLIQFFYIEQNILKES